MKDMIVVNVDKCLGCKSCEMACAVEHSESKEIGRAIMESPKPKARISVEQGSCFAVPLQCRHCEDAPCIKICPVDAMRREDKSGPVVVDHEKCIGCKWCILACPFGVINFDDDNRTVTKCDQCFERVERGEKPACVCACPTMALDFKSVEDTLKDERQARLLEIAKEWPANASIRKEDTMSRNNEKDLGTNEARLNCRVCGAPFASEKQIAKVKSSTNISCELAETCPKCRSKEFRSVMEETLGKG